MTNFKINDLEVNIQELTSSELKELAGGATVGLAFGADNTTVGGAAGGVNGPNGNAFDETVTAQFAAPGFQATFFTNN